MEDSNDLFSPLPPAAKINKTLSHYTSLDGFLNIIRESQIRASNILFLNDTEEMEYGMRVARDVLAEIDQVRPDTPLKRIARALTGMNDIPDVYACCFCEEHDMLSQWRGYGAATQSVSIQFDADQLSAVARAQEFDLHPVTYGKRQAMKVLRARLKGAESTASIVRALMNSKDETDYTADDARRMAVLDLAPRFKNDAFAEELEWRIIAKAHVVKKVEYRTRDNVIMPYVNVGALNTRLPISRVTVGPGKDASLTRKSIEKFLSQRPFYCDVEVAVSSIPFRT
ncbi:DUF2971 domain-containing protein [Rhizobium leguminosarum]